MPVIKFLSTLPATLPQLSSLAPRLCEIWRVPSDALRLLNVKAFDVHTSAAEQGATVYVEVRAKAKPERTDRAVEAAMAEMSELLAEHGHQADVRVELFDPALTHSYFRGKDSRFSRWD